MYRGIFPLDDPITISISLSQKPHLEWEELSVNGTSTTRCCSIKPHACENYDFDPRRGIHFVLARGMDIDGTKTDCVMPTVLFSVHEIPKDRYRGNAEPEHILLINKRKMNEFFYLFEQDIIFN